MTEEQIKEMLNGIINNGEKWEYRWCTADGWSNWKDYKLGYEIFDDYEYRKVETWYVYGHVNNFKLTSEFDTTLNIWHKGTKEECEKWIEEHTKKSWLEENYGDEDWVTDDIDANEIRVDAIEEVCKKILEEVDKEHGLCSASYYLKLIIKDLGIDLEQNNGTDRD